MNDFKKFCEQPIASTAFFTALLLFFCFLIAASSLFPDNFPQFRPKPLDSVAIINP